jgi:hypothetical protein
VRAQVQAKALVVEKELEKVREKAKVQAQVLETVLEQEPLHLHEVINHKEVLVVDTWAA